MKTRIGRYFLAAFYILFGGLFLSAATHYVAPTGDSIQDVDNIRGTIAAALPGDTIVLEAGTFRLDKVTTTEDALIQTATGTFWFFEDVLKPGGGWPGLPLTEWFEAVLVQKELTITGQLDPDGNRLTRIYSPDYEDRPIPSGGGIFVLNAPGIVLENLVFENLLSPVQAYSPGFIIRGCLFDNVRLATYLEVDIDLVYADPENPVKSYLCDNAFYQCNAGPHVAGAEIVISGNSFQDVWPWNNIAIVSRAEAPPSLDYSVSRGNVVENNTFDGARVAILVQNVPPPGLIEEVIIRNNRISNSVLGIIELARGEDAVHRNNRIIGNFLEGCPILMDVAWGGISEGNVIADNEFHGEIGLHDIQMVVRNFGTNTGHLVTGNRFVDIYNGGELFNAAIVAVGLENSVFEWNDYTESGIPGLRDEDGPPSLILAEGTRNNVVIESGGFTRGTGGSKYHVVDLGENNRVVGEAAKDVEPPAGIGQTLKESIYVLEE